MNETEWKQIFGLILSHLMWFQPIWYDSAIIWYDLIFN